VASREQIRIAYLVSQYPAVNHTFILREIRQLRCMGFEIHVASIRAVDRAYEHLSLEEQEEQREAFYIKPAGIGAALRANFAVLFFRPFSYFRGLAYSLRLAGSSLNAMVFNLFYFVEAVVFVNWMLRERLSQIHMHFSSTVGLIAQRIAPMRTSVTIHGPEEFADPGAFYLRQKIQAFDVICAISQYGRSQLMQLSDPSHWHKFRVSRLGIDPSVYAPRPFRDNPPFEILCVGRLSPVKGHQVLIGALDRLVREGRPVRLRLVGDGPSREALQSEVARRSLNRHIVFEGALNAERVLALYRQAHIFALPSFAEGIPVVLMEAMAMEIPCVTTWITGIPELIRNEIDGLLVPPSGEEELAVALTRLLDDSELRMRIGRSGRRRILEYYDLNRNTAVLATILREASSCP